MLQELAALVAVARVPSVSNATLEGAVASEVQKKAASFSAAANKKELKASRPQTYSPTDFVPAKSLTAVPSLDGHVALRPLDALRELATATLLGCNGGGLDTVASLWTWLRYIGVFEKNTGSLTLRADALSFAMHHDRAVVSEHMGVAFGIVAAKAWVRATGGRDPINILPVRAFLAGRVPGHLASGFGKISSMEPDYLISFSNSGAAATRSYRLIECKGTQDRSKLPSAMGHAVFQCDAVRYRGNPIPSLVTGVVSNDAEISIRAVDPEGEEPIVDLNEIYTSKYPTVQRGNVGPVNIDAWDIDEMQISASEQSRIHSLASLVGGSSMSSAWRVDDRYFFEKVRSLKAFGETWRGQTLEFSNSVCGFEVFFGLHETVARAVQQGQVAASVIAEARFFETRYDHVQAQLREREDGGAEQTRYSSLSQAGVLIDIQIRILR